MSPCSRVIDHLTTESERWLFVSLVFRISPLTLHAGKQSTRSEQAKGENTQKYTKYFKLLRKKDVIVIKVNLLDIKAVGT